MDDAVAKLLDISSESLIETNGPIEVNASGFDTDQLTEVLRRRNGFYAFESALHVFPSGASDGVMTLDTWNDRKLWIREYNGAADDLLFFAEDALCNQFAIRRDGSVVRFDPETAYCTETAPDVVGWAAAVLAGYEFLTAWPLMHEWQVKHGTMPEGRRLCAIIPFILGGEYVVTNLYAGDPVEHISLLADLHLQVGHLPPGTRVELQVGRPTFSLRVRRLMARARDSLRPRR
jgi:hypothetical protein